MKLRSLILAALLFAGLPLASSSAFVAVSVGFAPPPLPVYVQPACPVEGYIWNPGYWAYADVGYYWVPGVWVEPPRVGVYWTPGYWGFSGGSYAFNAGYWGPSVGYYGGINYGFGYGGVGYFGGEWAGGAFRYNTAVTRVNTTIIKNVYVNKTVIKNGTKPHGASFNGPNGVKAQPTAKEKAVADGEKVPLTPQQQKVREAASKNPELNAKKNGGKPKVAAVKTPDEVAGRAGAGDAAGSDKAGERGAGGAAGADKPGQKGAKADKPGNDGQAAGAIGRGDDAAAPAGKQADKGQNNKARKAEDISNDGAAPQETKAGKGRRQAENGMATQAANRNQTAKADRARSAEAAGNRTQQNRPQAGLNRQKGAQMKAAPRRGAPAGDAAPAAPNKKKKGANDDGGGRRGRF